MIVEKGIIEIEVFGETKGFKFGTYTFKVIRELTGIDTIEEVFTSLTASNSLEFLSSFVHACAIHYAREKKIEEPSELDVSNWMDEIGLTKSRDIVTALIKAFTTKNLNAPVTAGLEAQQ